MTRTHRLAIAALLLTGAASGVAPQAAHAGNRDFTLLNNLPVTATTLQLRPTGAVGWSADIFGAGVLPAGQQVRLPLGEGATCTFDLKVGLAGGVEAMVPAVNLCAVNRVALYFNGREVRYAAR